ncbi:MAG: hypothetical protein AAGE96_11900 [Cyanobacteria bacterium P01_G01_bin.19]
MGYKNLIIKSFAAGILLSCLPSSMIAWGNSVNRHQINYVKSSKVPHYEIRPQEITHILIGARIITRFSPRNDQGEKIELAKLASELGYDHFNWVSYVEQDPHGIVDRQGNAMLTPYNDPPVGGYQYDRADQFPFYWDVVSCDSCNQRHHINDHNNSQRYSLTFEDAPADYRLQPEESIEFLTSLVGVKKLDLENNNVEWDAIHTFRWKLTNPRPNYSHVSLIEKDVDFNQLSPTLLNTMVLDGAVLDNQIELSDISGVDW